VIAGSAIAVHPSTIRPTMAGMCHKRPLVRQNERGMFFGSIGRCGNPDFGAPSADAPDSRVSWPRQSVLNINFALCCPIESKRKSQLNPEIDGRRWRKLPSEAWYRR
jgi:hypothetical protein